MHDTLMTLGIISVVLTVGFFIASLSMFIGFKIPMLWKDSKGALEQKQIDEIRQMRNRNAGLRGKVNVFEELEKQAKPRRNGSQNIRLNTSGDLSKIDTKNKGTVVLKKTAKAISSDFIIEKDITFVSTNEVI